MMPGARALFTALVALGGATAAAPSADPSGTAILRPGGGDDAASWDGARMRDARERFKDLLPGRHG